MQQYNYLQAIYKSFYSPALYRDVKQNWGAGVVLYLFLLLAICCAIALVPIQQMINAHAKKFSEEAIPNLPKMNIKNGIAITPENRPYLIKDPHTGNNWIVIDTSGHYVNIEQANARVLLTKNEIFIKNDSDEIRAQKIPKSLTMSIVPNDIQRWISGVVGWAWVLIFPTLLFFSFVYRLIQAILYAMIGKFFAVLNDYFIPYSAVLKLVMISVTPAIIISTILDFFLISFHLQLLCYFILSMLYLYFAIRVNKTHQIKGKK